MAIAAASSTSEEQEENDDQEAKLKIDEATERARKEREQGDKERPHPWLRAFVRGEPHPDKKAKGGEDASMVSGCGRVLAVADGVGGWAARGVDPAIYSNGLMRALGRHVDQSAGQAPAEHVLESPYYYLDKAWREMQAQIIAGSTTALVVALDEELTLQICNVGDSALMVVRDGKVLLRTAEQQHGFNFPFQLGSRGDHVSSAQLLSLPALPGDVLVLGTDGLWDNLYDDEVLAVLAQSSGDLAAAAQELVRRASLVGHDPSAFSPFAKHSAGRFMGGKLDDVTVIVAVVQLGHVISRL